MTLKLIFRYRSLYLLLSVVLLISCKKDDEGAYTSLAIITEADAIQTIQDQAVEFSVFNNDLNIPSVGTLQVSTAVNGTVEIEKNGTASDPSDDRLLYTPNPNVTGVDQFTYTICSEDGDCVSENVEIAIISASEVVFNLSEMPYPKLSDYNFFKGNIADQNPNYGVVPYKPISALFTDYAKKKRFIWMPNNQAARYVEDDEVLNFPVGTILIKGFYYDNVQPQNNRRNIETRLMIRKEQGWIFANYVWDKAQTEATFDLNGGFTEIIWSQDGETKNTNYRIPAESQCFTCHESAERPIPIGPKPQNLNGLFAYEQGSMNQLEKLIEMGYLQKDVPSDIMTVVDWQDASQPVDLRMRSYVDINCAHCHSADSYCHYRPMRFEFGLTDNPENLGVCVEPDTPIPPYTKIVDPGNIENSVLYFRLNTTLEQYRMPLLGRTLIHEEHIALVEDWILSLNNCE